MSEGDPRSEPVLWRRLDHPGLEYLALIDTPQGPLLEGTVIANPHDTPLRVIYRVTCTRDWQTRHVVVDARIGGRREYLELVRDEDLRWLRNDLHVSSLDGCEDIDLSVTPSTNTLPIRRLGLAVGQSADVTAAWIKFPSLEIEPLPQRYTRVADRTYRYESRGGSFAATLEVDERGLVIDYPPAWERVRR